MDVDVGNFEEVFVDALVLGSALREGWSEEIDARRKRL